VITVGFTRRAAGNELRATELLAVAVADPRIGLAGPNKPVLPTATAWLTDDSFGLGRRQTGQPFGSFDEHWSGDYSELTGLMGKQEAGRRTTGNK
jgi:hypothetical protein